MSILEIVLAALLTLVMGFFIHSRLSLLEWRSLAKEARGSADRYEQYYESARKAHRETLDFYSDKRTVTTEQHQKLKVIEALEELHDKSEDAVLNEMTARVSGLSKKQLKFVKQQTGLDDLKLYNILTGPAFYR